MATYFTSDIHFGDEKIMKLCGRPFQTTREMDEYILKRWNEKVEPNDTVWIIGDLVDSEHFDKELLNRLNGRIYFLLGNCDLLSHGMVMDKTKIELYTESPFYFEGESLVMFHYPIMDWIGREEGTIHLYGHIQNRQVDGLTEYYADKLAFNVSMDANDFEPKTLKELVVAADKLEMYREKHGYYVKGFDY